MRFIVPGRIRGKGRPRFARHGNFVRTFTDANTVACEATVKHFASEAMRGRPLFEGPLWLSVTVWILHPQSWSKKRKVRSVYVAVKPDADNILKLIGDALNGIVWKDDAQLADVHIVRKYGDTERVEIEVGRCGYEIAEYPMVLHQAPDSSVRKAASRRHGATLNKPKHGFRNQVIAGRSDVDGYSRQKDDFYPTPERATLALLEVEKFTGPIWEPACGDGAISRLLKAADYDVVSSDLVDRGYGETRIDFLFEYSPRAPNIITNPPFKLAVPFVRHALRLTTGKVAMLLKIAFLEGRERALLFRDSPVARVHVFSQRLAFVPGGSTSARKLDGGGMMAFAWFVWEHGYSEPPRIGWL